MIYVGPVIYWGAVIILAGIVIYFVFLIAIKYFWKVSYRPISIGVDDGRQIKLSTDLAPLQQWLREGNCLGIKGKQGKTVYVPIGGDVDFRLIYQPSKRYSHQIETIVYRPAEADYWYVFLYKDRDIKVVTVSKKNISISTELIAELNILLEEVRNSLTLT